MLFLLFLLELYMSLHLWIRFFDRLLVGQSETEQNKGVSK